MNYHKLSDFAANFNGGGIEGAIESAIKSVNEGGVILFNASNSNNGFVSEYSVFSPIIINKSISIVGDSPGVKIINKSANNQPVFIIEPNVDNFYFSINNIQFLSGGHAVKISGSNFLAPNSRIYDVSFLYQTEKSIEIIVPQINIHLENVWISGNVKTGITLESNTDHDNFSLDKSRIEGCTIAGLEFRKELLGVGPIYISETEFLSNNQAIVVDNVRYYEHNVEYNENSENYILSGSSIRLTGSSGGGGGGGVTDHGALTGLGDDDHIQYLRTSGTRPMSGSLNMGGFNISNVGTVDGVDVSQTNAVVSVHITDLGNPHQTSLANITGTTLSVFNSKITDDDVVGLSQFNAISASMTASIVSLYAASSSFASVSSSFPTLSSSFAGISSSFVPMSASAASISSSFIPLSNSYSAISASYIATSATIISELISNTAELILHTSSITLLHGASSSFATVSGAFSPLSNSFARISSSFIFVSSAFVSHASRHLSGAIDPIDIQLLRADGIGRNRFFMGDGFGGVTSVLSSSLGFAPQLDFNSFTASSLNSSASFAGVSSSFVSHASRHLSGGVDPIDAQSLRANGIGINRVLISNGLGGWTTVLSSAFGGGGTGGTPDPHAPSHLSGGTDPIDIQSLRANGVPENHILIAHSSGGVRTVASSSLGFVLNSDYLPFTASITSSVNLLFSVSSTMENELNLLTASVTRLNSASGTFETELNALTNSVVLLQNASSSTESRFTSVTSSITSLFGASSSFGTVSGAFSPLSNSFSAISSSHISTSASYRTQLVSLTSSVNNLTAFSNSHASRHLSGGADPIDAHLLRGNNVAANRLLISDGSGGWTTVISTSVGTPPGAPANHATTHHSGGSDPLDIQSLRANGFAQNFIFITHPSGGVAGILTSSLGMVIDSDLRPFSSSITASVVRLDLASGTYNSRINLLIAASATFEDELISLTSSVVRLDNASSSFASLSRSFAPLSNSFAAISASYISTSASFRSELTSLTSSVTSLFGASSSFATVSGAFSPLSNSFAAISASHISTSASFRAQLVSLTSSIDNLTAFSSSHASRHLSGGADPIDAQALRANAITANRLLISNGLGGWTTVDSGSVGQAGSGLPGDFGLFSSSITASVGLLIAASATFETELNALTTSVGLLFNASGTHESRLIANTSSINLLFNASGTHEVRLISLTSSILLLQSASSSIESRLGFNTSSITTLFGASSSFGTVSGAFSPLSNSFAFISSSHISTSASFRNELTLLTASVVRLFAASGTFRNELTLLTSSINNLTSFSSSHASRHLSGGADPIDAQLLRANAIAANRLLISNGLGGWTTVLSESVGTPPGAPGAHASSHLSGGSDPIDAQSLRADGIAINQVLISNGLGGWTTVASSSIGGGGPGGGITAVLSATSEGRTLISGTFGSTVYLKTLKSLTSSIDNLALSDTSPILLSSSDDTIYIRRRPSSRAQYLFDDFIGGVTTAAGFAWTFVAGGTGASIQVDNVDLSTTNRASYMGPAVGMISLDTGTTAAGGVTLNSAINSFSLRHMSASSIEWRLMFSGGQAAGTQEARVQFGWLDTTASGTRRPVNGIYFEMTSSNFGNWNIVSSSGSVHTAYNTGVPINSASFRNYKIETIGFPPTSSFYINDTLVGAISSTMPYDRKPFGPMVKISKEIGTGQRDLFVDWCEIFYESIRD